MQGANSGLGALVWLLLLTTFLRRRKLLEVNDHFPIFVENVSSMVLELWPQNIGVVINLQHFDIDRFLPAR